MFLKTDEIGGQDHKAKPCGDQSEGLVGVAKKTHDS